MLAHTDKLLNELETQLKTISLAENSTLILAQKSAIICEQSLAKLKDVVSNKKFKSTEEEIFFFKKVKPKFSSKLYFNVLLFELERKRPQGNIRSQIQYLEEAQLKVDRYFTKNLDFCTYYRLDSTLLDDRYFVRDKLNLQLSFDEVFFNYDRGFSTNRDSKVAQIMANDMLSSYILRELKRIEEDTSPVENYSNLNWSETKASLTLLIYAFHTVACFNGGNVELKELALSFSKFCNVDLGDFYRTWAEIKLKKDPTKFLDTLKIAIENRIKADLQ